MASTSTEHFRAYKPQPFTREEREHVTILFGGLHWRAEQLIQGALERLGYNIRVLPPATKADLLTGRAVADVGQCCPTSFTTGNLANFLREEVEKSSPEEVAKNYVYLTAGACGACRFGQYHQSYELALRNSGLESFRQFLLAQEGFNQGAVHGGGIELNPPFTLGAICGILVSDVVQDLEYQTRPYEVVPGETDRVVRESIDYLYEVFRKAPVPAGKVASALWYLRTDYFLEALREVHRRFREIRVDRLRVKPVVKITGEFYLQTVEGEANYNIHRWLEAEGAEVYPAAVTVWLDYLKRIACQDLADQRGIRRHARLKLLGVRAVQRLLRWNYKRMRHALGDVPHELPDQAEIRDLAAPWFHSHMKGGEGDMLVGKALWSFKRNKAHMICELSPYACMPNTMSIGAMAGVLGRHPEILYAPLEIKGDAEVHALSRCQMVLTEARRRAQQEFEEVLEQTGLDTDTAREMLEALPEAGYAAWPVPRCGATGTAANLVLHLAGRRYRSSAAGDEAPAAAPVPLEPAVSIPVSFDYGGRGICTPCTPCVPCVPEPRPSS
jgi:predicted nucleotide-binding protein (sugar kinase/HSP70/actin superfamily)